MKVFKYPLKFDGTLQTIVLPQDSEILDVEFQGEELFIWVLIDEKCQILIKQRIQMLGTGWNYQHPIECMNHIKTIHKDGFVWHFFDVGMSTLEEGE